MKKNILLPVFLVATFWLVSCSDQEKEWQATPGCRISQCNNTVFTYSSDGDKLRTLSSPGSNYTFTYDTKGHLTEIKDSQLSTTYAVKTDATGNITEALGYTFMYDTQNRLVQYEKSTGEIDSYRRFEYADNNLSKVFGKALSPFPSEGPPAIVEVFSQGNFLYDTRQTPWQNNKVVQWAVATSLLIPFEIADQASSYSLHNVTGYSIYYAADPTRPRFTSSVAYTYGDNALPVTYVATGSAGAYKCTYNYLCGSTRDN